MSVIISQLPPGVLRADEGERIEMLGTVNLYKSHAHETAGATFIWETQTPPGAMVPPHMHTVEDEFIYLVEGEMEITIGGTTHTVHPGDLVKLPKGVPHAIRSTGTTISKAIWTAVPAGKMESLFRTLAALPADQPPNPAQIAQIFTAHDIVLLPPPGA